MDAFATPKVDHPSPFLPQTYLFILYEKNYITLLNPLTNELNIPKPSIAFY